jgi:hypothetical protein
VHELIWNWLPMYVTAEQGICMMVVKYMILIRGRLHVRFRLRFGVRFAANMCIPQVIFLFVFAEMCIQTVNCNGWQMKNGIPIWLACKNIMKSYGEAYTDSYMCRRPLRGRVQLRDDLRFNLRFGACVGVPTQENALPGCVTRQRSHRIPGRIAGQNASGHSPLRTT